MTELITDTPMHALRTSPGALIKAAREQAGVHMAVLSVNLKVSIKQLEALEADQFDRLPEPVFTRAMAAKVCRFLKLDPHPVLALMPLPTNGLKPLRIIDANHSAPYNANRIDHRNLFKNSSLKMWFVVLALCLLAFGVTSEWSASVLQSDSAKETAEVVPTMPPVQEAVAPDAAQAELPKAMVFDSAATSSATPSPTALNPSQPAQPEFKK